MASLFDENLNSSDSEDDDYVPDGEVTSEDDDDNLPLEKDDEIETKKNSKKSGKVRDAEGEKDKIAEEPSSAVDEKKRANDLFKSFLEEVEAEMKIKEPEVNIAYDPPGETDSVVKSNEKVPEKPSSCELFEFAGETVAVSVVNDCISSEKSSGSEFEKNSNVESNMSDESSNLLPVIKPKPKGLASVLNTIQNKKSKLTTLEKTKLDWRQFKNEHGISEELQNYNKGRGGFIERKRFLERSDLRSYEIERDMRMIKRKKN